MAGMRLALRRRRDELRPVWARVATLSMSGVFMDSFPLDARETGAGVIERGQLDSPRRAKSTKTSPGPLHARYVERVVREGYDLVDAPLGGDHVAPLDDGRKAVGHDE